MRFLPKILAALFHPIPLPPAPAASSREVRSLPVDERIAAMVARMGDRMIQAETGTVAAHRERVETMFNTFGRSLEDHHGR